MSFLDFKKNVSQINFDDYFSKVSKNDVLKALNKRKVDYYDYLTLLSPVGENCLEEMAQKSRELSLQHFGKTILLYTPMYLSNHCVNVCAYCGFNKENNIPRKKLTAEEIEKEAKQIAATGLKHILILTGESREETPVSYIKDSVKILKKYFQGIAIEIYPLEENEYKALIDAGVDSLTIYQEVYDEEIYDKVHISGPKKDYKYRLDAPERACKAQIRGVNIGALLGINNWREEAFMTGLHGQYLQDKYPEVELSISLPRMRPHVGHKNYKELVNDKNLVQIMLASRIFLPRAGITISTREQKSFRDNLVPLGVTKMSAGVSTEVGGHSSEEKTPSQFDISDERTVQEMKEMILSKGYQPIFKDWMAI
ncbi:2-iminoacetate synthase ThiH [Serpentinicella sp. ANB-PHB4]|uniref:2-iminoacetate synthase ThiH n=1 Tax=Serpentinicella sp. ANB-PHB4 TaxID=3074076 RepID=UPI00285BFDF3|nr:2-iminoacetate synthase ThiH [Serpentinicella sp. ANB-PHB4]MDR5658724.1 2-iminoacetate synthase ThiH [Serpentinicella sp. ANB-PHB4]